MFKPHILKSISFIVSQLPSICTPFLHHFKIGMRVEQAGKQLKVEEDRKTLTQ